MDARRRTTRELTQLWIAFFACMLGACASPTNSLVLRSTGRAPVAASPWFADEHPSLTLRDVRLFGSHNSYHRAPRLSISHWFDYDHGSLQTQLDNGLRQFELDVRYVRGRMQVGHLPVVDGRTHCATLDECVRGLKRWSKQHPQHLPIVVFIEPKEDIVPSSLEGRIDALDAVIKHIVPRKQLLTPDDVTAGFATLREATIAHGLTSLSAARGKIMFVLFGNEHHVQTYAAGRPTLAGRLMFAATRDFRAPFASIVNVDRARDKRLETAIEMGLLVRTRSDRGLLRDPLLRRAALDSGAQFVSSDFVSGLDDWLGLDPLAPARCNPASRVSACAGHKLSELNRALWGAAQRPLEHFAHR